MTNERLEELMRQAGYAAPELAMRAKTLASLILKDQQQQYTTQLALELAFKDSELAKGLTT